MISYKFTGGIVTRTEQGTTCENGAWRRVGHATSANLNDSKHPLADLEFVVEGDDLIPSRVYIRAEIDTEGTIVSVGAGSGGRNGRFETDDRDSDDIYVGLRP